MKALQCLGAMLLADIQHDTIQLVAVCRKVHTVAVLYRFMLELRAVVVPEIQAVLANLLYILAQPLELTEVVQGRITHERHEQRHHFTALDFIRIL